MKKNPALDFLRTMAVIMLLAGALGSIGFVLNEGRHTPVFLLILFVGWVLLPFIALLIVNVLSKPWPVPARKTLSILMLLIPIGSLLIYSGIWRPADTRPAAIFLVVPLISYLLIVAVIAITRKLTRNSVTNKK